MARVPRPAGPHGSALLRAMASRHPDALTAFFARAVREHPGLAHMAVAGEHVYLLGAPDLVREVFVAHGRTTTKSRGLEVARHLLGRGLLTSEGDLHVQQRRLVQPAFHERRVRGYAAAMVEAALALDARWGALPAGSRVDMAAEMSALALEVAGATLFGTDLRDASDRVGAAVGAALTGFRRAMLPGGLLLLRLPLPSSRRTLAAEAELDTVVRRLIAARRAAGTQGRDDVLSTLLAAGLPDAQVRDEVMTLLLAGHETTAMALTWAWHLLDDHPDVAEWLVS